MKKLNLGCGKDILDGYVNADQLKLDGVDVVHDFDQFPWPFEDNSFDEVYSSHFLEHVENLPEVMKEIHRICKSKVKINIRVPHFSCGVSYRDPTHKTLFSYFMFDYFTEDSFYGLAQFRIVKRKLNFTRLAFPWLNYIVNPLVNLSPLLYERFFCWMLPVAEVIAELEVKK